MGGDTPIAEGEGSKGWKVPATVFWLRSLVPFACLLVLHSLDGFVVEIFATLHLGSTLR